jgi:hypothetical protein
VWRHGGHVARTVHRRALILDDPFPLTVSVEDLQRP